RPAIWNSADGIHWSPGDAGWLRDRRPGGVLPRGGRPVAPTASHGAAGASHTGAATETWSSIDGETWTPGPKLDGSIETFGAIGSPARVPIDVRGAGVAFLPAELAG